MKDVRINLTNDEKMAQSIVGLEGTQFNMKEDSINNLLATEKQRKFNSELDKIAEKFSNCGEKIKENAEAFGEDISKIEIKPMFTRLLIKPLAQNPFQRIKIENGIVVDAGGFTLHDQINPNTGKVQEQVEFIKTAAVQEVGPDVKYIQPGDVIFYRIDCAVPVPFFKEGLYSTSEQNVIAVVNEDLENRFKNIK